MWTGAMKDQSYGKKVHSSVKAPYDSNRLLEPENQAREAPCFHCDSKDRHRF